MVGHAKSGYEEDVRTALRSAMTDEDRLLTVLHYGEGLTVGEIAVVLERSEDEVLEALARLHLRMGLRLDQCARAMADAD